MAPVTRPSNVLAAILVIALSLFALGGCSRGDSALDGTQWMLKEWTLSSLNPADFTITAEFAQGMISGRSGVNSYSGPYRLGSGNAFAVGQIASTEMAGPEPAMRAEGAYMTLLRQARSYKLAEGRLTLFDEGGNESLIFEAASG
jgi:heat shock protein HslJ